MTAPIEPVSLELPSAKGPDSRQRPPLGPILGVLALLVVAGAGGVLWLRTGEEPPAGRQTVPTERMASPQPSPLPRPTPEPTPTPEPVFGATWILDSEPPGARVLVSGQYVGQSPVSVRIKEAGLYTGIVQKAGYSTATLSWTAGSGQLQSNRVVLVQELGELLLDGVPPGARWSLNGGAAQPVQDDLLRLPTLRHRFEMTAPGYQMLEGTFTPHAEYRRELEVVMKPLATPTAKAPGSVAKHAMGIPLVRIPLPQEVFRIGSPRGEQGRSSNEGRVPVRFTRNVLMAEREVSNEEFRKFDPAHRSGSFKGRSLDQPDQPATGMSWQHAAAFCNWMSREQHLEEAYEDVAGSLRLKQPVSQGYRLPSEAEWEYAARQGREQNRYPWGSSVPPLPGSGNLADQSAKRLLLDVRSDYDDGQDVSAPVPFSKPNGFGIHDLAGNVAEWVGDVYAPRLTDNAIEVDPQGPSVDSPLHVIKGSSFQSASISELRCAQRSYGKGMRIDVGFRICRYVD